MTTTIKLHAKRSPSGSFRWALCHASYQRENAIVRAIRESNLAADGGTCMHDLAEHILKDEHNDFAERRRGTVARVDDQGRVVYAPKDSSFAKDCPVEIDDDLVDGAINYADYVRQLALGGELHVEQRLSIAHITGEDDAKGTSDAVILFPGEICIADLKGGYKRVFAKYPVDEWLKPYVPEGVTIFPNPQLVMYAEAAREEYEKTHGPFDNVRLIIVMPRLNHTDEYVMSIAEFKMWVQWIKDQADGCLSPNPRVVPNEKSCEYCAAFPCAEAEKATLQAALGDFDSLDNITEIAKPANHELGQKKRILPLVRMWCDWVEQHTYSELAQGRLVPGWKLVDGDMGDRQWREDPTPQLMMLGLDEPDYTTKKVVGPAAIEKLVVKKRRTPGKKLTSDQWEQLQPLIKREQGGPKVVPDSDPRPARVEDPASDFEDETNGGNAEFF